METVVFNLILVLQIILFGQPSSKPLLANAYSPMQYEYWPGCRNAVLLGGGRDPMGQMHYSVQRDKWMAWQRLFSGTTQRVHNLPFAQFKCLQVLGQHG